jgi:hypothetical protein
MFAKFIATARGRVRHIDNNDGYPLCGMSINPEAFDTRGARVGYVDHNRRQPASVHTGHLFYDEPFGATASGFWELPVCGRCITELDRFVANIRIGL